MAIIALSHHFFFEDSAPKACLVGKKYVFLQPISNTTKKHY